MELLALACSPAAGWKPVPPRSRLGGGGGLSPACAARSRFFQRPVLQWTIDFTGKRRAAGGTANGAAGGTVEIPAGIYLSGPITLPSAVNLQVDGGAILRMLPITTYPGGMVNPANFISGSRLHDIEISVSGSLWFQPGKFTWHLRAFALNPDCNRSCPIDVRGNIPHSLLFAGLFHRWFPLRCPFSQRYGIEH